MSAHLVELGLWLVLTLVGGLFSTATNPVFLFPVGIYVAYLLLLTLWRQPGGKLLVLIVGAGLIGPAILLVGDLVRHLAYLLYAGDAPVTFAFAGEVPSRKQRALEKQKQLEALKYVDITAGISIPLEMVDTLPPEVDKAQLAHNLSRFTRIGPLPPEPLPDGESIITALAAMFKTSPYRILAGLVEFIKQSDSNQTVIPTWLRAELEFYSRLFDRLADPPQLLGSIIRTEKEPLLTWVVRDEVVQALVSLYREDEIARKLLGQFIGYDNNLILSRRLAGLGQPELARALHQAMLDRASGDRRVAGLVTLVLGLTTVGAIAYEVLAYTRDPARWELSIGAVTLLTAIGFFLAASMWVRSGRALKTAHQSFDVEFVDLRRRYSG